MKFKSAKIKAFRRFTDLTVQGIPETTRLIMLAGPNGCGKSSFFDALNVWHDGKSRGTINWFNDYFSKGLSFLKQDSETEFEINFYGSISNIKRENRKVLYVRSAYRNDPDFQINELRRTQDILDEVRIQRMIDNDVAVSRNYERLVSQVFEDIFDGQNEATTIGQFRKKILGDIRKALLGLFPDLELDSLENPQNGGTFRFTKGTSHGFPFKNLSGGEKAAFDLILDLVVARRGYDDTVFCIDEPESHMNARLQAQLLSILYELIPENCQLMLATHSIGMMRRARDIEAENPGSVVFLDFGDRDFDQPQVIEPIFPDRAFWNRAYKVALDDLASLVAPSRVVICEGHPKTNSPVSNHSHDARCYEAIFKSEFSETRFVSMGNDREIVGDKRGLGETLRLLVGGLEVVHLIDRDDRSKEEIEEANRQGVRVLSRRNLESYLFDDEVLQALTSRHRPDKWDELLAEKTRIQDKIDGPRDNLKPVSGEIYNACKKILGLTECGNDAKAFMRDTLAPLVKPDMAIYKELRHNIFDTQGALRSSQ